MYGKWMFTKGHTKIYPQNYLRDNSDRGQKLQYSRYVYETLLQHQITCNASMIYRQHFYIYIILFYLNFFQKSFISYTNKCIILKSC